MRTLWSKLCNAFGIDTRALSALTRTFLLMDLRQQHYASATVTKPHHVISPLFFVIGQCLTASAALCLFLFARTDVHFFSFANLSLSLLVLVSIIFVEFQEIIVNPNDLSVVGHRPVSSRTYGAARFLNLLFFVALAYVGLNVIPMIMGYGLRDANLWYVPAYFVASLSGSITLVAVLVFVLSFVGASRSFDGLRAILSWTQIVLILVVVYSGQFMLRDTSYRALMWGAFPPQWTQYLPSSWLASYVTEACYSPSSALIVQGMVMMGIALLACAVVVVRLNHLYARLQPKTGRASKPSKAHRSASLRIVWIEWLLPSMEQRAGFWICRAHLFRDVSLLLRCLLPFHVPVALMILGLLLDQWANPMTVHNPERVTLSILSIYLFVVAVPTVIYQLSFCEDNQGSWILLASPLESPSDFLRGLCKAVMVYLVTPFALVLGIVTYFAWKDPVASLLHTLLAWALAWPAALAGVWLLLQSVPFSLPPARGGALGVPPLPLFGITIVAVTLTTIHYFCASYVLFWTLAIPVVLLLTMWVSRRAEKQVLRLWRPT